MYKVGLRLLAVDIEAAESGGAYYYCLMKLLFLCVPMFYCGPDGGIRP
jgi:hypothetical protein